VRAAGAGAGAHIVRSTSTLAAGRFFERDVESALPFSETAFAGNEDALVDNDNDNVLIDGEKVIFVSGVSGPLSRRRSVQ